MGSAFGLADFAELGGERHAVDAVMGQREEQRDTIQHVAKGADKGFPLAFPFDLGRIFDPQWAVIGRPGQTGQVSPAASSQTVIMRSIFGAPEAANSSQLLERSPSVG